MNNQLTTLIEQHQDQMANLQTAQVDPESVFANVLTEFAIGESELSLSAVLNSIEKIIEFAEFQRIDLGSDAVFPLLRTLVNSYYGDQDIDQQDRALGLLGRPLFQLSRNEIDGSTAEEIIRIIAPRPTRSLGRVTKLSTLFADSACGYQSLNGGSHTHQLQKRPCMLLE